jgi:hypothetical protein
MVGVSTNGVTAGEGKASQRVVGFVTPDAATGVTTLRITSLATGNEVHTEEVAALDLDSLGGGQRAFVTTFTKKDRTVGYRVLLVAADSTLCLLQQKVIIRIRIRIIFIRAPWLFNSGELCNFLDGLNRTNTHLGIPNLASDRSKRDFSTLYLDFPSSPDFKSQGARKHAYAGTTE